METTTDESERLIYRATCLLADNTLNFRADGIGFDKYDAQFGSSLAYLPNGKRRPFEWWTSKQKRAAYKMLRRYKRQLAEYGIIYDDLKEPELVKKEERAVDKTIRTDHSYFYLPYPHNDYAVNDIYAMGGSWSKSDKSYHIKVHSQSCKAILEFAYKYNWKLAEGVTEFINNFMVDAKEQLEASRATVSDFAVPGLNGELRDFQKAGVEYLVRNKRVILADSMGLGKTIQSLAALTAVQAKHTIVVCPKSLKINWRKEAQKWVKDIGDPVILSGTPKPEQARKIGTYILLTQKLRNVAGVDDLESLVAESKRWEAISARDMTTKRMMKPKEVSEILGTKRIKKIKFEVDPDLEKQFGTEWANDFAEWRNLRLQLGELASLSDEKLVIINYDVLKKWLSVLNLITWDVVIGDEIHNCKSSKTIRSAAMRELAEGREYVFGLTGTPLLNAPWEVISPLEIIDRFEELGGWYPFVKRFCNAYKEWYPSMSKPVWNIKGAMNLDELNDILRQRCYIRRTKEEVLKELPPKTRTVIDTELDNREEYDRAEADLISYVRELSTEEEEFLNSIAHLPIEERAQKIKERADLAENRYRRGESFVKMSKLRQLAARGKLEAVKEWVQNYVDSGEKILVFAWHKEIVKELAKALDAPFITGDVDEKTRDKIVTDFQTKDEAQVIILNIRAGAVGWTLTGTPTRPCSNVAFIECDWSPMMNEQAEDRVHRIGQVADSVNAWYFVGLDTVDEEIWKVLENKRKVIEHGTEGDKDESAKTEARILKMLEERRKARVDGN